jgi:hypothetical protein
MHSRIAISDDAQRRAVRALREIHRSPRLEQEWAELRPEQRIGYVISVLLNLPVDCCAYHVELSRRIIRRYLKSRACPHVAFRRRACEIITAVALVDGHPPCVTLEPPPLRHGTS